MSQPQVAAPKEPPPRWPRPGLAERFRAGLAGLRHLRGFGTRQILLRAAALTYLSIVSLVPLLAVGFVGVQVLGLIDLGEKARTFIFDNLAVGVREEVAQHLTELMSNAGKGLSSGGIGLLVLGLSAVLLLRNIEKAFDELWGRQQMRPIQKQLLLYIGLLIAGPIVLGLSLAVTATLKTWAAVTGVPFGQRIFLVVPFVLSAVGFTLLYKVAPASRVRWRAALVAGIVAATVWEGAKVGYAAYAVYSLREGSIYGPLAALPTFLVWIYLSWLIVLFGARLSFAIQHPERLRLAADPRAAAKAIELCALRVMLACNGARFEAPHHLAQAIGFPDEMVYAVIDDLEAAGLLAVEGGIHLGQDPAAIEIGAILRAVRGGRPGGRDPVNRALNELLGRGDRASLDALSLDLATFARSLEPDAPGDAAALASR